MKKSKMMDEQSKSLELLAMERLLRNDSSLKLNKKVQSEIEGRTIMKKDMKKRANEKEYTFNFYTSSNAHERYESKEREQFMCPLTNEIIIEAVTLHCGHIFSLQALRSYFKQQRQMSRDKREQELELVKCPLCGEQMELLEFRKLLVS